MVCSFNYLNIFNEHNKGQCHPQGVNKSVGKVKALPTAPRIGVHPFKFKLQENHQG